MKKCKYTQSELLAYLQNRMSMKEESEFQRHLLSCPVCVEELERLRQSINTLTSIKGSQKLWWIAAAVACSITIGICITQSEQPDTIPGYEHPFNYMPEKRYQQCDTAEVDSTSSKRDSANRIENIKKPNKMP